MKLFINGVMSVSIRDILSLESMGIEIPKVITDKVHSYMEQQPTFVDTYCTFEDEDSIKFLKEADYIVDYNEYKKLSEKEKSKLIRDANNEIERILVDSLNLKPYDKEKTDLLTDRFKKSRFKLSSYNEYSSKDTKVLIKRK